MFRHIALIILLRWIAQTDALANSRVKHSTPISRITDFREDVSTTVNCSEAC